VQQLGSYYSFIDTAISSGAAVASVAGRASPAGTVFHASLAARARAGWRTSRPRGASKTANWSSRRCETKHHAPSHALAILCVHSLNRTAGTMLAFGRRDLFPPPAGSAYTDQTVPLWQRWLCNLRRSRRCSITPKRPGCSPSTPRRPRTPTSALAQVQHECPLLLPDWLVQSSSTESKAAEHAPLLLQERLPTTATTASSRPRFPSRRRCLRGTRS
jgi:hypothetical protein